MVATEGAAKPAPAAGRIERGGTYTVRRGDTLAKIASAAYGNIDRWPEIWMENYEVLGEKPEIPEPGTRLRIPR
jgi:nucleoid-associated protein YgaU